MGVDGLRPVSIAAVMHSSPQKTGGKRSQETEATSAGARSLYTSNFAVKPAPPVEDTNLMRRNFACTPVTVRASPAVAVVVSIDELFIDQDRARRFLRADTDYEEEGLRLVCDFADVPFDRVVQRARKRYALAA
jgi:hypothetical protein